MGEQDPLDKEQKAQFTTGKNGKSDNIRTVHFISVENMCRIPTNHPVKKMIQNKK